MPENDLYITPITCYQTPSEITLFHLGKVAEVYTRARNDKAIFRGLVPDEGLVERVVTSPSAPILVDPAILPSMIKLVGHQLVALHQQQSFNMSYFFIQPNDGTHQLFSLALELAYGALQFPLKIYSFQIRPRQPLITH